MINLFILLFWPIDVSSVESLATCPALPHRIAIASMKKKSSTKNSKLYIIMMFMKNDHKFIDTTYLNL